MNLIRVINCQYKRCKRYLVNKTKEISLGRFPNLYDKIRYYQMSGQKLDYKHPSDINQKLFWLNRYWQPSVKALCADKYRMREYLSKKGLDYLSVPLLGVWENAGDIDFDKLPNCFVLKCNHGCAYNILCRDKSRLDKDAAVKQLNEWLKSDYSKYCGERHYAKIKPCVICEEYLEDSGHKVLPDYKVYCFNGNPIYILLCQERKDDGNEALYAIFSPEWIRLPYVRDEKEYKADIPRPSKLSEMLSVSCSLSSDFPFVRLDYYVIDEKLFLGEFTFTPQGNFLTYKTNDIAIELGKKLIIK